MSAYSTSITSDYTPSHVLPSPTLNSSFASNQAIAAGPVDQKYLREKIATAFLVMYSLSGLFLVGAASLALAVLVASIILNGQMYRNLINIGILGIGIVCMLTSAIFTLLICNSPAYYYEKKFKRMSLILIISSAILVLLSVALFFSGLFSDKVAEFQGSFFGLIYGLVGMQIARECYSEKDDKQASFLVPFKIA